MLAQEASRSCRGADACRPAVSAAGVGQFGGAPSARRTMIRRRPPCLPAPRSVARYETLVGPRSRTAAKACASVTPGGSAGSALTKMGAAKAVFSINLAVAIVAAAGGINAALHVGRRSICRIVPRARYSASTGGPIAGPIDRPLSASSSKSWEMSGPGRHQGCRGGGVSISRTSENSRILRRLAVLP